MSVRATERLIGDLVKVTDLPDGPLMIVKAINEETKIINTSWFTSSQLYQEGYFPATALDRAEAKASPKTGKSTKPKKAASKK